MHESEEREGGEGGEEGEAGTQLRQFLPPIGLRDFGWRERGGGGGGGGSPMDHDQDRRRFIVPHTSHIGSPMVCTHLLVASTPGIPCCRDVWCRSSCRIPRHRNSIRPLRCTCT
jgi:hypothetical protein